MSWIAAGLPGIEPGCRTPPSRTFSLPFTLLEAEWLLLDQQQISSKKTCLDFSN